MVAAGRQSGIRQRRPPNRAVLIPCPPSQRSSSGGQQEPRRFPRSTSRARLGIRPPGRNTVGRRARGTAAEQTPRRRPPDRDRRRPRLPLHRLTLDHPPARRLERRRLAREEHERALDAMPVRVVIQPAQLGIFLQPYLPPEGPRATDRIVADMIQLMVRANMGGSELRKERSCTRAGRARSKFSVT